MCEDLEWFEWRREAEQRARKEKEDEIMRQAKTATQPKSPQPARENKESVPA